MASYSQPKSVALDVAFEDDSFDDDSGPIVIIGAFYERYWHTLCAFQFVRT